MYSAKSHIKAKKQKQYKSKTCRCLMEGHEVKTAREAMDTVNRLNSAAHKNQWDCKCDNCNKDQQCRGCSNPHKCALMTKALLDNLMEKWDLCLKGYLQQFEMRQSNNIWLQVWHKGLLLPSKEMGRLWLDWHDEQRYLESDYSSTEAVWHSNILSVDKGSQWWY